MVRLLASKDAFARYAGPDVEKANLHDDDRAVLTRTDLEAAHYTLAQEDLPLPTATDGEG